MSKKTNKWNHKFALSKEAAKKAFSSDKDYVKVYQKKQKESYAAIEESIGKMDVDPYALKVPYVI